MSNDTKLSDRPQSGARQGPLRRLILPLLVIAAIVGSIWYLESGRGLPLLGSRGPQARVAAQDGTFFSLEAQGIKLGASGGPAPKLDEPAPDFTLLDLDGKVVHLSDFRGKTVVLNFWATWCVPCRREFPELVETYERNKDQGLVIIGVNLAENPASVRKFADDYGVKYPILLDTKGSVAAQYRVQGLPMTWFIDSEGLARGQIIGVLTKGLLATNLSQAGFSAGSP